ncbi:MAG: glutamate-cysteine ligase family protein [Tunicatimonas sp.]
MGNLNVKLVDSQKDQNENTRCILRDLKALESMLDNAWFNEEPIHIGAEQELCLVDEHCKPAPISMAVLERLTSDGYTTELAKFNLEFNLDPLEFTGDCFSQMAANTQEKINELAALGEDMNFRTVMTGILPTLRKSDLGMSNLTPLDRYHALVKAISKMRGSKHELHIRGVDELNVKHDSALLEACNTSFQVHLQIAPAEFVAKYNIALAITAPVLAIAANSPLLFNKRLWNETRIALFQQSIDTRAVSEHLRDRSPRVTFGNDWLTRSVIDLYREDIARFRPMLMADYEQNVLEQLADGKTPELRALMTHNSTVYRWNRPCYGISPNGKPHLRIENRILPAGPSVPDEVANAAFWVGLMEGFSDAYDDITRWLEFDDVQANFVAAAFSGHETEITWIKGQKLSVAELIEKELLPLAEAGLKKRQVAASDIDHCLGIIAERNRTRQTGSGWLLKSYHKIGKEVMHDERSATLTSAMIKHQQSGRPVHQWELAAKDDSVAWSPTSLLIEEFMTRDVFTVEKDDIPELAASIMDWQKVRFVPVEDDKGRLLGLVSARKLIRHLIDRAANKEESNCTVADLMIADPITISPEKTVMEAMRVMKKNNAACLPVVKKGRLVGIISEGSFLNVTASLLDALGEQPEE